MLMARDMARCFDPVLLAEDCGVTPDPWQADLLRTASRRVLMLCSRQSGKTETAVIKVIHQALYDPGLCVVVSPSQRQSSEVFKRFLQRYGELHRLFVGGAACNPGCPPSPRAQRLPKRSFRD